MKDVSTAACSLTDASAACYTASWYLIWDQVRYWLLIQSPIVALSIVYEWLEVSSNARVEQLRKLIFDTPFANVLVRPAMLTLGICGLALTDLRFVWQNDLLQIVTCCYVCVAWSKIYATA